MSAERELLLRLTESFRRQRHDFFNHLQVIRGYLQLGKVERALEYVDQVAAPGPQQEISRVTEEMLQAILLDWYFNLTARGVRVTVRVTEEFAQEPVPEWSGCAEAFYAFAGGCGEEIAGEAEEDLFTADIDLVFREGGFSCRYMLYRDGALAEEREFISG
ncbi:MAG: Spo0B domain-containing protein [Gracilibacteraceae bacterium]|jgi:hypothetical protein|nr:Spo0B domain-containing protein [Gracilibacteraceae bacterium]